MSRIFSVVLIAVLCSAMSFGQNLVLSANSSFTGSGTYVVKGNIDNTSAGAAKTISGTVQMASTAGNQTIGGSANQINFGTLQVNTNTGGTVTSTNTAIAVTTALSVAAGSDLDVSGDNLYLGGTSTLNGTGDLVTDGSSTVEYNQVGTTQSLLNVTYAGALVMSNTSAKSIGGAVSVSGASTHSGGDLTISNTGSLGLGTTGSFAVVNNNGDFTGGSGTAAFSGAFTQNDAGASLNAGAGLLDFAGNLVNTSGDITLGASESMAIGGDFTYTAGTISFNATSTVTYDGAAQAVAGGASIAYGVLVTEGSSVKTASGNITASSLDNGGTAPASVTLDMDTYTLSATSKDNESSTIRLGGSNGFSFGTTGVAAGTVIYDGVADQTIAAGSYYQLQFEGANVKNILVAESVTTGSSVSIATGTTLNLNAASSALTVGGSLTVDGTVDNSGTITIGN